MAEHFYEDRYQHCRDRMAERFNLELTYDEWQELNLRIFMDGEGVQWLDTGESTNSSLVVLQAFGQRMLVAYSETGYAMMTVFPRSDTRLLHARNNTYTARATHGGMLAYRDARRATADSLDTLEDDGFGRLVMPKGAKPVEAPKTANPFADALADFKPLPAPRPILTLAASNPKAVEPAPVDDGDVLTMFARLDKHLTEQSERLDQRAAGVEAEIEVLETRLAGLRAGDAGATMEREFVAMSRDMAEQAFAKFQDGLLDVEATLSIARLMLAQQGQAEGVSRAA